MQIAGQKTQALDLSQWSQDAKDFDIRIDGAIVKGSPSLTLLGIKFREAQMRTVANGYVHGAMEHAAAAWPGHVELLDRELRAAARVITGCPRSTPVAPLMAEAGLPTAQIRRGVLAARMLCTARSLPPGDPLRLISEQDPPRGLSSTTGWRRLGAEALRLSGVEYVPVEERLHVQLPPWTDLACVAFHWSLGSGASRDAPDSVRWATAEAHLSTLLADATWIWSDRSAEEAVPAGEEERCWSSGTAGKFGPPLAVSAPVLAPSSSPCGQC